MMGGLKAQLATKHTTVASSMDAAQQLESQNAMLLEQVRTHRCEPVAVNLSL